MTETLRTEIDIMELPGDVQRIMRTQGVHGKRVDLYVAPGLDMPFLKKTDDSRYIMSAILPAPDGHTETKIARHVGRYTLLDVPRRAALGGRPEDYQAWIDQPRTLEHEPGLVYLHLLENRPVGLDAAMVVQTVVSMRADTLREITRSDKYPEVSVTIKHRRR
ncbi:MAG: hypothetical protein EOP64_00080 [Sphingomonas sp.]|nr:MAG: hypothetical protein EOP64_00080 [Sphingomonas sp.]